jgi:hypothetical protein
LEITRQFRREIRKMVDIEGEFMWFAYRDEEDGAPKAVCPGLHLFVQCGTGAFTARDRNIARGCLKEAVDLLLRLCDEELRREGGHPPPMTQEQTTAYMGSFFRVLTRFPENHKAFWDYGEIQQAS